MVLPVWLHPDRERERGYHPAELIARPLARRLHLKQGAYLEVRTKPGPARLVSRKERWESIRGTYATRKGLRVDKIRVLLVDDVKAAGSTFNRVPAPLRAQASLVLGFRVAQVVPRWSPSSGPLPRDRADKPTGCGEHPY